MKNSKENFKFAAMLIALIAAVVLVLMNFKGVCAFLLKFLSIISPFLVGMGIAFVMNEILKPLEKLWIKIFKNSKKDIAKKLKRPVCLILSFIIVVGIIAALFLIIIPEVTKTVETIIEALPDYTKKADVWLKKVSKFFEKHGDILPEFKIDLSKITTKITDYFKDKGEIIVNKTLQLTSSLISTVVNIVLALAFAAYLLAQKEKIGRQAKKALYAIVPEKHFKKVYNIIVLTDKTFSNFISGQLVEAVIIGCLCFLGMMIFKMPYAGAVSILVGFTALIPVFGSIIGTAIGAFLILFIDPSKAFWFVVFIIILQQLEGNLIYPRVVGKSVGLPGIWVLVAVTVGGGAFGFIGMLIGVPTASVLYQLFRNYVNRKNVEKDSAKELQKNID